jgi:DNA-binding transcriptional LysR family regulator
MDRLSAMQAFVRVVEAGSFVRAAERLGISTSALSARIAELEAHLGARLLNRTTRTLSLTEPGQSYYERCVQLLADVDEADAVAGQAAARPRGTIRLTCSYNMGQRVIAPAIAEFVARYPDVKFDVMVSDRLVDLVDEGFDLAIRAGNVGAEQQVARPLGSMQLVLAAAPSYLKARGVPRTPAELADHAALTYAYAPAVRVWRLLDGAGQAHEVRVSGSLHANSGEVLMSAAIAGLGLVNEPDFMLNEAIDDGRLVRVLPDYEGIRGGIWAVYPSRRHLSLKVRLFVDHIGERFVRVPAAQAGVAGKRPRRAAPRRR